MTYAVSAARNKKLRLKGLSDRKKLTQSPQSIQVDLNSHLQVFVAKVGLKLLLHAVLFIAWIANSGLHHIYRTIIRAWNCRLLQITQTEGRTHKTLKSDRIMKSI